MSSIQDKYEESVFDWIDWLFRDRSSNKIVVAQFPNTSLWIALSLLTLDMIFRPTGTAGAMTSVMVAAAFLWWALDEALRGVNPWRRFLGVAVICLTLWSLVTGLL